MIYVALSGFIRFFLLLQMAFCYTFGIKIERLVYRGDIDFIASDFNSLLTPFCCVENDGFNFYFQRPKHCNPVNMKNAFLDFKLNTINGKMLFAIIFKN